MPPSDLCQSEGPYGRTFCALPLGHVGPCGWEASAPICIACLSTPGEQYGQPCPACQGQQWKDRALAAEAVVVRLHAFRDGLLVASEHGGIAGVVMAQLSDAVAAVLSGREVKG